VIIADLADDTLILISLILCLVTGPTTLPPTFSALNDTTEMVVLRFGGDCLLAEHYERDTGDDPHRAFKNFDLFRTADIAMVNLECPVTQRGTRQEKPFTFRMHSRYLPTIAEAGIDVVNIANNHIFDFGAVGLFDTIHLLDSAGLAHVGAGKNLDEAYEPVILQVRGKRIGFLGYYGGGESPVATEKRPGVARRALDRMVEDIDVLKNQGTCDAVIVNLHWGTEKSIVPELDQVEQAHRLVDAGADVIVGHHPHVWQAVEHYKSGVIAYSLGNLVFGGNSRSTYDTAILEIRLGLPEILHRVIPVRIDSWNARALTGEEAAMFIHNVSRLPIPTIHDRTEKESTR